ncbi:hypothetical protein ACWEO4_45440 [Streptomyces sp. NPDC004393]|uniref:hypothetical protein n=1 Tax=Streptomyces sp. NPDC004533 TaxID=3154278 RepID=UPI0033B42E7B
MSRAVWAYVPAGSGPGRLQRIARNSRDTQVQRAYRAYIDHGRNCATCAVDSAQCPTAEDLWGRYQAATRSS